VAYDLSDRLTLQAAGRTSTVNFEQGDIRTLAQVDTTTLNVRRTRGRKLDLESEQYNARAVATLRLPGDTFSNEVSLGYEHFRHDLAFVNRNLPNSAIPPINIANPVYLTGGLQERLGPNVPFEQFSKFNEVFAQNVLRFSGFTVTGAVRHIWSEFDSTDKLQNTVYQLGGTYAVTDRVSLFAGANSGFNANADIAADRNRSGERFDPETYRQVEAGLKTSLLAGVTGTFSVFRLNRKDILVADPIDAAFLIQAGEERSQGFEADAVWNVSNAFALRGGYAYLDAEITSDTNPARSGKRKPGAPRHQFNVYGAYTIVKGPLRNLRLSAAAFRSGKAFASISNLAERPAYTVANFTASYSFDRYRIDAILTNALNKRYFIARNEAQVHAGEPQLFTVRLASRL
jgi:iron complex outermembrane receptor protein